MGRVRGSLRSLALTIAIVSAACGDGPTKPDPIVDPPPPPPPVNNSAPVISSITVQGTRRNEPASFSDLGETVAVTAAVTDAETNVDLLQYNWTATLGSFTGTGSRVSWVAPAAAMAPSTVTITLEVVERFGTNQENRVSRTAPVALHDNTKEVGDMAVRFLTEFSKPQTNKDWQRHHARLQGVRVSRSRRGRPTSSTRRRESLLRTSSCTTTRWIAARGDDRFRRHVHRRPGRCAATPAPRSPVMWDSTNLRNEGSRRPREAPTTLTAMFVACRQPMVALFQPASAERHARHSVLSR